MHAQVCLPTTFFTERKFYFISTKCKKLNEYFSSVLDTLWKSDTSKEKEMKTYHHGAREMEAGTKLLQLRWQIGRLSKSSWVLIIALFSVIIKKKLSKYSISILNLKKKINTKPKLPHWYLFSFNAGILFKLCKTCIYVMIVSRWVTPYQLCYQSWTAMNTNSMDLWFIVFNE